MQRNRIELSLLLCALGCSPFDPVSGAVLSLDAEIAHGGGFDAGVDAGPPRAVSYPSPDWPADFLALPLAVSEASGLAPYDPVPVQRFAPVQKAPRALPPISGGTLASSAAGRVVVSDPDRDQLYVIDAALKQVQTIPLQPGQEPGRIATEQERAYVALRAGGLLLTVDLSVPRVTASTSVCAAPRGVSVDSPRGRVLVACAGGDLVSVSLDGTRVLAKNYVAPDLRDVGSDAQGAWVTQFRSAELVRLDQDLRELRRRRPAPATASSAGGTRTFAPSLAWRTVTGPDGEPFMLHQRAQTSPVVLIPPGATTQTASHAYGGGGAVSTGPGPFCESGIVHTTVSRFGGVGEAAALAALPQAVVPSDLSFAPDGRLIALSAPGNFAQDTPLETGSLLVRQLYLFSPAALGPHLGVTLGVGGPPLLLDNDDCLRGAARAEHQFPGEATSVHFLDAKTLLVQVRDPAELHVLRFDAKDQPRLASVLALSPTRLRDTGHEVFHQNTGLGIACASCHGEALDDAHVWNFGAAGLRRTQQLRGGVLARAPFHWSGELPTLGALIHDVYEQRMGAAPLSEEASSGLGAWLDALPPLPAEAREAGAVARGRALFESAEVDCSRCHAGAALGSNTLYDVGTGGMFKAPSLRGVGLRLPLMHSGCADTLQKRFDPVCGGAEHGATLQLDASQIADLSAYLSSL